MILLSQLRGWSAMGRRRIRLPVAAKIALPSAGAIGGTPGSPTPPGGASLSTMYTCVLWRDVHPRHHIIGEIGLLDPPLTDRYATIKRVAEPHHCGPLPLGAHSIGLHGQASMR